MEEPIDPQYIVLMLEKEEDDGRRHDAGDQSADAGAQSPQMKPVDKDGVCLLYTSRCV